MSVEVGKIVEGKVSGITNFGAFIQLEDGETGLVHISEVAEEYIKDIKLHLTVDQIVKVKVLSVGNGKISLSIKAASEPFAKPIDSAGNARPESFEKRERFEKRDRFDRKSAPTGPPTFDDMVAKFMKDAVERMHDVKKNKDNKKRRGPSKKQ